MENGPFIVDFPIKTSIYEGFSMAMLNNQRVFFFLFYLFFGLAARTTDYWSRWGHWSRLVTDASGPWLVITVQKDLQGGAPVR